MVARDHDRPNAGRAAGRAPPLSLLRAAGRSCPPDRRRPGSSSSNGIARRRNGRDRPEPARAEHRRPSGALSRMTSRRRASVSARPGRRAAPPCISPGSTSGAPLRNITKPPSVRHHDRHRLAVRIERDFVDHARPWSGPSTLPSCAATIRRSFGRIADDLPGAFAIARGTDLRVVAAAAISEPASARRRR